MAESRFKRPSVVVPPPTAEEPIAEEIQPVILELVEEEENSGFIAIDTNTQEDDDATEPYLKVPVSDMKKLFSTNNVLPVPVHGITISINLDEFQKISDANPDALSTINALSTMLEAELTVEDAIKIRDKQVFSFKTGSSVMEDIMATMDTASLTIITPTLVHALKVEDVGIESFDFDETLTMVKVKEQYQEQTGGLSKILKKSTVVTILNMMQEEEPEKEFMFYANLIDKMPDSNTAKLALIQMRLNMQYALNTDTIKLQSVMTDMLTNQGGSE